MAPAAWAAYEVSQSDITANLLTNTPTKWTEDMTVEWTQPSMVSDILNGYYYQWNNSASSLNVADTLFTSFSASAGYPGCSTVMDPASPKVVKPKAELADLNSGDFLYLHIITSYLDIASGTGARVSADVVYGPFLIDNVAPQGTVRIVDASGNDITSTSDTNVKVKMAASADTAKAYLNETPDIISSLQLTTYSTDATYPFANTTPGPKTIYAWFEDAVGNVTPSQSPATYNITLLASTTISPNTWTLDLAAGATKVFIVEGTADSYSWAISDPTVAEFVDGVNTGNSVTVKALKVGTFTLTAGSLTSGTITVVQSFTRGDVNRDKEITAQDAVDCFWLAFQTSWTYDELATADFNQDNEVTSQDAVDIFWESLK